MQREPTTHLQIPWRDVATIGNILRHNYERIAHDILWNVVRLDLPELERILPGGTRRRAEQSVGCNRALARIAPI